MCFLPLIFARTHDDKKFSVTFTIFIQVLMRDLELLAPYWLGKLRILLPSALWPVHLNTLQLKIVVTKENLKGQKNSIQISIFTSF